MTLRIELSIIPFGNEDDKKVIETINISNIGSKMDKRFCNYVVEHNKYKTGEGPIVTHQRSLGAIELARRALEELLNVETERAQPDID